jgi:uncharacterized lipoprotein YmbA
MNGLHRCFAVAWLASLGLGCSSAPVRYYTLTPTPDTGPPARMTPPIDVRVLHIPSQLDRAELMVRTGPTDVTFLDNEHWASPVKDELKQALWVELRRRLGRVTGLRPALTSLSIDLDVRRLEAQLGQYALIEASWSATLPAGTSSAGARAVACTFRADEKIGTGYAGMVEGYQREIAALADAIVTVVTSPASGIDAPCQKSIDQ